MSESTSWPIQSIGRLVSDYPAKFGVPRQPGLVVAARGILTLASPFDDPLAVSGLADYSHLWLSFLFDRNPDRWQPRVRPPRLGGNARRGVFATRSPMRPNRLGLSVVRLLDIATTPQPAWPPWDVPGLPPESRSRTHLLIGGHDLVSATPILDIKPYLPWVDHVAEATAGMAASVPASWPVDWTPEAEQAVTARPDAASLRALIEQVLAQDPRPAYRRRRHDERAHGVALRDVNVRFCMTALHGSSVMQVLAVHPLT